MAIKILSLRWLTRNLLPGLSLMLLACSAPNQAELMVINRSGDTFVTMEIALEGTDPVEIVHLSPDERKSIRFEGFAESAYMVNAEKEDASVVYSELGYLLPKFNYTDTLLIKWDGAFTLKRAKPEPR